VDSTSHLHTLYCKRFVRLRVLFKTHITASRHSYGKTAATVRTMCDPFWTMSSIRQERAYQVQPSERQPSWSGRSSFIYGNCVHQFNRPDVSLQGPDAPSLIMVISCSRSATVRTWPCYGSFQRYLGEEVVVDRPDARSSRPDTLKYFGYNFLLKYRIGTKLASLESLEKIL
jgi:hypothetical protein